MKIKEPIFVSEVRKQNNEHGVKVDWVDVWLKNSAIEKLKKEGCLTLTEGRIIVRLMTAEDKISFLDFSKLGEREE